MARPGACAFAPTENPQLRRPVRESQAQAMDVGVARADFDFDLGQFPAAAGASCCPDPAFLGDLLKRAPVAIEPGFLAGQRLPALDHYVNVFGSSSMPQQTRSVS